MIRPYCIFLLALLRISFLGRCHGICGLFIVSAPGKLCIYACLYRSNAHGNLPADVPPALIQTTVTRTFARPAVNLCRLSQRKRPVQMRTCLWSTSALQNSKNRMGTNKKKKKKTNVLEVQLSSFLRSLVPPKKVSAASAEDIVKNLISKDAAGKQKLHVR